MNPQIGRAAFRIPAFLLVCSVVLLFFEPRGTAAFSITIVTLGVAIIFMAVIVIALRVLNR